MRYFVRRLGGDDLADDLAQMTFLKAWRSAAAYRGDGSYEGWLLQIAWTIFLSDRRRHRPVVKDDESSTPDVNTGIDLSRALATLPERERGAALLCLGEGWSHGEAAEILDIPLGTLKACLPGRARASPLIWKEFGMTDPIDIQLAQLLTAPERVPDEAFVARTETMVRFDRVRTASRKAALARVGPEATASGAVVLAFASAARIGEASEQVALFSAAMAGLVALGLWCALTLRSPARRHAAG